tara:strand:+ start:159 stop:632 length:474 start_codon:yes stop_codon:yes gene_type:complete
MSNSREQNEKMILELLAIGEDINLCNFKLQQLIVNLRSDAGVLGNIKELAGKLVGKIRDLDSRVRTYTPTKVEIDKMGTPSYVVDGTIGPQRIFNGPKDYDPTIVEQDNIVKEVVKKNNKVAVVTPTKKPQRNVQKKSIVRNTPTGKRPARKPLGNK